MRAPTRYPTQNLTTRRQRGKRVYAEAQRAYWTCLRCGVDLRSAGAPAGQILATGVAPGEVRTTYRCAGCGARQTRRRRTKFT